MYGFVLLFIRRMVSVDALFMIVLDVTVWSLPCTWLKMSLKNVLCYPFFRYYDQI